MYVKGGLGSEIFGSVLKAYLLLNRILDLKHRTKTITICCNLQTHPLVGGSAAVAMASLQKSSSSSSSRSSKVRENGEIPGYSSCIEEIQYTGATIKSCCDRVGGSYSKTGFFPTCKK